ncbi:ribosomal protein S18-alanine N-acetyltransferase [Thermoleophilia bacterium SCSIO 60948]|nr:ribosomal protein S18-alanine N-acetyltransferase [Thermoleophilia bacterium SCSIO 60948]
MSETETGAPSERVAEPGDAAGLEIRRLAYADLPQVVSIERRAFTTPWSLAMFVLELSKPSGVMLAAIREERIVGYLVCSRYVDVWHLMNIAVDPRLRRLGIASRLMDSMLERGGREESYTLEVRPSNLAAIALYRDKGFRAAGHRRRYYHDNGEDALIMWRGEVPFGA